MAIRLEVVVQFFCLWLTWGWGLLGFDILEKGVDVCMVVAVPGFDVVFTVLFVLGFGWHRLG